jgi:hypothetical protein
LYNNISKLERPIKLQNIIKNLKEKNTMDKIENTLQNIFLTQVEMVNEYLSNYKDEEEITISVKTIRTLVDIATAGISYVNRDYDRVKEFLERH